MGRRSGSKPAASKASAKPAQQQEQDTKHHARRRTRKRPHKPAAAQHLGDDSDPDSLLGELEDDDCEWDPTAADNEDDLADEFLAGLADELDMQHESDEEEAACQPRREPKSAR